MGRYSGKASGSEGEGDSREHVVFEDPKMSDYQGTFRALLYTIPAQEGRRAQRVYKDQVVCLKTFASAGLEPRVTNWGKSWRKRLQ